MFKKIENFENAVEFLLLKSIFYTLECLRISNWKMISYNIKQLHHLLKTMRIFAWSQYLQKLVSVGAISRFIFNFFANQNFSRHRKAKLLHKWTALVLQVKLRFMGCLVKANSLVLGNIALSLSSVNSISFYETAICREIFCKCFFASIFVNF